MKEIIHTIGFIAAVVLPFWNIPLIMKIVKRKSSKDISLSWALGVWICILLMFPSGVTSTDFTWKVFNIVNLVLFTLVVITTLKYRKG
ncbi:MAG TPA: hypothetical protein VJA17_04460 [Candidatus Omnitrophota bacterium]|nr:hypothetical protein [Candidatus Omnitrophota bacterium]